jgi:uncharacterized membrane protein
MMRWQKAAIAVIILISLALGIFFYGQLPERMASHWNASGQADGYSEKGMGVFLIPGLLVFLAVLWFVIPKIDPKRKNIEAFREQYDTFFVIISIFFLLVYAQILLWNMGTEISPNLVMPIGLGILFFYIGVLVESAKQNWFVGIRTPWTLSSEKVWDRTHKLGGKLYKVAGVIALLGILSLEHAVWFIIVPVLLVSGYLIIYSYLEYKKENGKG